MIRKATSSDIEAVTEIYDNIHEKELKKELCVGWIPNVYPTRATAENALQRGDLFVYEENGKVTASAIINREQVDVYREGNWAFDAKDSEVMVLHTLVVEPSAGKKGVGKKFVEFYESYSASAGCKVLRMDTNEKNTVARRFYSKLGYREAGIVPCEFNGIPGVHLVLLEKAL